MMLCLEKKKEKTPKRKSQPSIFKFMTKVAVDDGSLGPGTCAASDVCASDEVEHGDT